MADERERQIRERLATRGWMPGQMATDLVYLLDALAAAREENGRLVAELRTQGYIFQDGEKLWLGRALKCADYPALTAALAREDGGD